MKKHYIFLILILFSSHIYCQLYHPLPDSNAKWCIEYNNHVIPPPIWGYTDYWETSYAGDTIILGKEYKKIEKTTYNIYCLNNHSIPLYIGALRDDSINKKVFYIPQGQTEEVLLYDFNLEIGDTLFSYLQSQTLIVDNIDSVFIMNEFHKRIIFNDGICPVTSIIEGIGCETGLVEELVAFEGGSYLCALYVDTLLIYPEYGPCNLSATDTCLTANLNNYDDFLSQITIFPNPTNSDCYLNIPENILYQNPKIQIVSSIGINCGEFQLLNKTNKISLGKLSKGIYIVNLYINSKLILRKKIAKM